MRPLASPDSVFHHLTDDNESAPHYQRGSREFAGPAGSPDVAAFRSENAATSGEVLANLKPVVVSIELGLKPPAFAYLAETSSGGVSWTIRRHVETTFMFASGVNDVIPFPMEPFFCILKINFHGPPKWRTSSHYRIVFLYDTTIHGGGSAIIWPSPKFIVAHEAFTDNNGESYPSVV